MVFVNTKDKDTPSFDKARGLGKHRTTIVIHTESSVMDLFTSKTLYVRKRTTFPGTK